MAVAEHERSDAVFDAEPLRALCVGCGEPVLIAVVPPLAHRGGPGALLVTAEPFEWEPRAACQSCAWTRSRMGCPVDTPDEEGEAPARAYARVDCPRCGGSGYVGERRPPGYLLAVDVAWADEGRIRLVAPSTRRRMGEALYPLHKCLDNDDQPAIVPVPEHERQAA